MNENEEKKVVSLVGAREEKKEKSQDNVEQKKQVVCSFCERPNYQVIKMIEGPGVNICSECTMICVQYFMLADRVPSDEVKKVLDALWHTSKRK